MGLEAKFSGEDVEILGTQEEAEGPYINAIDRTVCRLLLRSGVWSIEYDCHMVTA